MTNSDWKVVSWYGGAIESGITRQMKEDHLTHRLRRLRWARGNQWSDSKKGGAVVWSGKGSRSHTLILPMDTFHGARYDQRGKDHDIFMNWPFGFEDRSSNPVSSHKWKSVCWSYWSLFVLIVRPSDNQVNCQSPLQRDLGEGFLQAWMAVIWTACMEKRTQYLAQAGVVSTSILYILNALADF